MNSKLKLVELQKNILQKHEGKYVLLQSQYYPNGEGSLYVHVLFNVSTTKANGRDVHVIYHPYAGQEYRRHAFKEGRFEGEITQWSKHEISSYFFPVRIPDTVFVLGNPTNLEDKLNNLNLETKQLTSDNLKEQFPDVKQIWPAEVKKQ